MDEFIAEKDKISWKLIILEHIKKILELSRVEFRGGYYSQQGEQQFYIGDTRQPYINAVNSLSDVLLPFFDEKMKKVNEEILKEIKKVKSLKYVFHKSQVEKEWKKKRDSLKTEPNFYITEQFQTKFFRANRSDSNELGLIRSERELELRRELFQQLSLLLNRVDYLKTTIYSEDEESNEIVDTDKVAK